jgi:hypothetical protein
VEHLRDRQGFVVQENDSACFVYAVANAAVAIGRQPFSDAMLDDLKRIGCCHQGAALHRPAIIDKADFSPSGGGLVWPSLRWTKSPKAVMDNGGVMTILHPICNFHSMLLMPHSRKDGYVAVNSFVGPSVFTMADTDLAKFMPPWPWQHDHWAFSKRVEFPRCEESD